jgi:hypothetical protein
MGGGARPARVMLYGCRDDAPGRRTSLHAGRLVRYLIIVLEISGPWRHLIMIKGTCVHWAFQATKLESCDLQLRQGTSTVGPTTRGVTRGMISSGRANQHPFNWAPHPNGYPPKLIDRTPHFLSPTGVLQPRPYRLSRRKLPPRLHDSTLSRGVSPSLRARPTRLVAPVHT